MNITEHRQLNVPAGGGRIISAPTFIRSTRRGGYHPPVSPMATAQAVADNVSLAQLYYIAHNIYEHTEFPKDFNANQLIESIMYAIAKNACTSTFSIEEDSNENTPTTH